jgi:hypothetical protein
VSCPAMGVSGEMHPVCGFALAAHRLAAAERVVEAARAFSDEMGESHWGYSGKSPCSEKHNQLEHALIAYDAATAAREGR